MILLLDVHVFVMRVVMLGNDLVRLIHHSTHRVIISSNAKIFISFNCCALHPNISVLNTERERWSSNAHHGGDGKIPIRLEEANMAGSSRFNRSSMRNFKRSTLLDS